MIIKTDKGIIQVKCNYLFSIYRKDKNYNEIAFSDNLNIGDRIYCNNIWHTIKTIERKV